MKVLKAVYGICLCTLVLIARFSAHRAWGGGGTLEIGGGDVPLGP